MVLESILTPETAEKHPTILLVFGFVIAIVASMLSTWIFSDYSSLVFVFLTTLASVPLIYRTIILEEKKDLSDLKEVFLLKEHWKALNFFIHLFIGVTLGVALLYIVLPSSTLSTHFEAQINTLSSINPVSSAVITGNASRFDIFKNILFNNLNVTIFCILFSFLYGVGAIFILTWNASVIGVAIGNFIRSNFAMYSNLIGLHKLSVYLKVVSIGLTKYVIHGIPEILGYFVAGLGGGIISIAVIRHNVGSRKFEHVLVDSADLLLLSIAIIFVAAFLEVYITPLIF